MNTNDFRRRARLQAARMLPPLLRFLPEPMGRGVCVAIGRAGHRLVARDRRLARKNLARVHPEWSEDRVRREARRVFEEIGVTVYDFLRYPALGEGARERLVRVEGLEILDELRDAGRGALLVTAHLGCWELLAAELSRRGYPLRALARPLREPRLNEALIAHRRRMGVATLSSEGASPAALRHLRRGGFLGVLADQRTKQGGVMVRFLGQRTRMTDGPARLALSARAALVPLGIRRLADRTHLVSVRPPLAPPADREAVAAVTQEMALALGTLIEAAPEQWVWIHPRWEEPATEEPERAEPAAQGSGCPEAVPEGFSPEEPGGWRSPCASG